MRSRLARTLVAPLVLLGAASTVRAGEDVAAPRRAWLGVTVVTIVPQGGDAPSKLTVTRVLPDSPAERAGLKAGDVLLRIDRTTLTRAEDLAQALSKLPAGRDVKLEVQRAERTIPITARLAESTRPDADARRVLGVLPAERAATLTYDGNRQRAQLGVELLDLTPGLASYLGAPAGQGVLVSSVPEGSAPQAAGLRAGDVVVRVAGQPIESATSLAQALRGRKPDEVVAVDVLRRGARKTLQLRLVEEQVPTWYLEREAPQQPLLSATPKAPNDQELEQLKAQLERLLAEVEALRGGTALSERRVRNARP